MPGGESGGNACVHVSVREREAGPDWASGAPGVLPGGLAAKWPQIIKHNTGA